MSCIASTSDSLKIHDWASGKLKQEYKSESDSGIIKSISWSRDGTWLLVVPSSGPSEVISVKENLKLLQTIEDIYQPTYAVFQNNTKRNIAIGTVSGEILVYDIKRRNVKKRFPRAPSTIFNFKWNSKDSHIAAACIKGDIIVFNNMSLNTSSTYKVPNSVTVSTINFHSNRRNLLGAGSEEGVVAVWDITTNKVLSYLKAHQGLVTGSIFSPLRSDLLISSGLDRRLQFYDMLSNKCVAEVELKNCATAVDFSPCGVYLAAGSQTGNIILYDTRNFTHPISAFVAHEHKKIRHLFFQKVLAGNESENLSILSIPEDAPKKIQNVEFKNFVDSSGLIGYDDADNKGVENNSYKLKSQDSFLTALGLDSSVNVSEISIKYEDFRLTSTRQEHEIPPGIDKEKPFSLQNTVSNLKSCIKQVSSTPKHIIENFPSMTESPIIAEGLEIPTSSIEEIKQACKDIIQKELQSKLQEFKTDLKFDLLEAVHDVRRQILSLQMVSVKESILLETKLNLLNNNLKRLEYLQNKEHEKIQQF